MKQIVTNAGLSFKRVGSMLCVLIGLLFGVPGRILLTIGTFFGEVGTLLIEDEEPEEEEEKIESFKLDIDV